MFEANGENWAPSRKIWNQHAYFNVNINDDGTIPPEQQKHHLFTSSGLCGPAGLKPLNTFLNQSPYLTTDGCSDYAAVDLTFAGNVVVNPPVCPNEYFTISFDVTNDGDRDMEGYLPISFYDGDPSLAASSLLSTVLPFVTIPKAYHRHRQQPESKGALVIILLYTSRSNDDGSQAPPVVFPVTSILECDYSQNVGTADINPLPVPIIATKLADDNRCLDADSLANGEASAWVHESYTEYYEDFEDLLETTNNDGGSTPWSLTKGAGFTGSAEVYLDGSNKVFEVNDGRDVVTWETGNISISDFDTVNVSLFLRSVSLRR